MNSHQICPLCRKGFKSRHITACAHTVAQVCVYYENKLKDMEQLQHELIAEKELVGAMINVSEELIKKVLWGK